MAGRPDGAHDRQVLDRLASADDATLVERAQDGDVVAFEVLVRLHAPTTRAMARRVLDGSGSWA